MNQVFATPTTQVTPEIGDDVRVWLTNDGQQVRPQILEGRLIFIRRFLDGSFSEIVVRSNKTGENTYLHGYQFGTIEVVD